MPSRRVLIGIALGFLALAIAVYGTSLTYGFVRWDDGLLITENPAVYEISPGSIAWAFTHLDPELYIPLTVMSYQIDHFIGSGSPFPFHLTNLLLHTINALLVAIFVYLLIGVGKVTKGAKVTKGMWIALFCGLLFVVHPIHTEAVVWASARKDVLSGFFFLLTLVLYVGGQKSVGSGQWSVIRSQWWAIVTFCLGLLAKASIVPLPIILLLIDYYKGRNIRSKDVWMEKIPYFALSILFGLIAVFGKTGVIAAVTPMQTFLMGMRSTVFALQKLLWPTNLSVLYPVSEITLADPQFFISALLCATLALLVFLFRKNRLVFFCAGLFMIMLLPSFSNFGKTGGFFIGSDRYSYLASIGVFLFVLMIVSSRRILNTVHIAVLSVLVVLLGYMAHTQAATWQNSETLFSNAIAIYPNVSLFPYHNLGNVYRRQGNLEKAIETFEHAIHILPHPKTHANLGAVFRLQGKMAEAMEQYRTAIELDPMDPDPYFGLGIVYAERGDYTNARKAYLDAIDRDPRLAEAYSNLGALYMSAGKLSEARDAYLNAIEVNPLFVEAYFNLGAVAAKLQDTDQAIKAYEAAVRIRPSTVPARINLGILYYNAGEIAKAKRQFEQVLRYDPTNPSALSALKQMGI